jgi:hypothetical protein
MPQMWRHTSNRLHFRKANKSTHRSIANDHKLDRPGSHNEALTAARNTLGPWTDVAFSRSREVDPAALPIIQYRNPIIGASRNCAVTGVRFCFPAARRMEKKKVKRSIDKFPPPPLISRTVKTAIKHVQKTFLSLSFASHK